MEKMSQQRMQVSHLIARNSDTATATIHLDRTRLKGELCPVPGNGPPSFSDTEISYRTRDSWLRDNFKRPVVDNQVIETMLATTQGPSNTRSCGMSPWAFERTAAQASGTAYPVGANSAWTYGFMAKFDHEVHVAHPTIRHVFSNGVSPPRISTPCCPLAALKEAESTSPRKDTSLRKAGGLIATPRGARPDEDVVGRTRRRNTTKTYRHDRHFYWREATSALPCLRD